MAEAVGIAMVKSKYGDQGLSQWEKGGGQKNHVVGSVENMFCLSCFQEEIVSQKARLEYFYRVAFQ